VLRPQATKVSPIRAFVESNRRAATAIERRLPSAEPLTEDYELAVERGMNASAGLVVDVGGGRRCVFAKHRRSAAKIVAVDMSAQELSHNEDVDERIVADATKELPFANDSVDIVCSRSVVSPLSHQPGVRVLGHGLRLHARRSRRADRRSQDLRRLSLLRARRWFAVERIG
jgi:Methyltransferase domain